MNSVLDRRAPDATWGLIWGQISLVAWTGSTLIGALEPLQC